MEIDDSVKIPFVNSANRHGNQKYDFENLKHGSSIHAADEMKAMSIIASFRYFKNSRGSDLKAMRRMVDHTDPKGPGYRVWFFNPQTSDEI